MREGEEGAFNLLMQKYFRHCWKMARNFKKQFPGLDITVEDYYSVLCETLLDTILRFNLKSLKFYEYWKVCAENVLKSYVKSNYFKNKDRVFSLDHSYVAGNTLSDYIGEKDEVIHDDLLYESFHSIIYNPKLKFSDKEIAIVEYVLCGYSVDDIAAELNKSRATIYRHYKKAVEKMRKALTKNE